MQTESFIVKNVKCSGCASTIRRALTRVPGVREVRIEIAGARVQVEGVELSRAELGRTLCALGYPEVA
jgi:copper chaperone